MEQWFSRLTLATVAAVTLASLPASAQVINLSTGLNAVGAPLADGAADPFWKISTDGGATFTGTVVLGDAFNVPCGCGILSNAPTGKWINRTGVIDSGEPIGPTVLTRRTFDLTGYTLGTVSLAGTWAVMDSDIGIYLNGVAIPGTTEIYPAFTPWTSLHAFSVSGASLFLAGVNTIEFRTTTVNAVYDGVLMRDAYVRGDYTPPGTSVPEPASLALVATGLAGLAFAARRRRAAA